MKANTYDVIIAGLGAMGSAAAYHLASGGSRVLGLDRFHPPHELGSSHGLTRIIREAYFEHPSYVPLVQRAYQLWTALEEQSGRNLFLQTGGVMVGRPDGVLVSGARKSAEEHRLRHEVLSSVELRQRFPVFEPTAEMVAVWEPRAGVLFPELAIQTHLDLAARQGASLCFNEPVVKWEANGQGVRVHTAVRTYLAGQLLLAAGSWTQSLVEELRLPLTVERQVLYWFEPRSQAASFAPSTCPIYIWEYVPGRFFYGFPELGDGVKVALHHQGEPAKPETVHREVAEQEIESMRELLKRFIPSSEGRLRATAVCLYTNTPDEHFILDRHPQHPQVFLASPCSGHGFKFSSVIGELAAMLLRDQKSSLDLQLFRISRFGRAK
jgi:sarcosine oxidase